MAHIQGIEPKQGSTTSSLQYSYLDVFGGDEDGMCELISPLLICYPLLLVPTDFSSVCSDEPVSRINVWQLEGSTDQKDLLRFGVNSSNAELTAVLICVDFARPWKLVSSLQKWLDSASTFIDSLNLDPKRLTDLKQNCAHEFSSLLSYRYSFHDGTAFRVKY